MGNKNIKFILSVGISFRNKPFPNAQIQTQQPAGTAIIITKSAGGWFLAMKGQSEAGWFRADQEPVLALALKHLRYDLRLSLVNKKAIDHLNHVVIGIWAGKSNQKEATERFQILLSNIYILQDLSQSAQGYLIGDPNAEARFINFIEGLRGQPEKIPLGDAVPANATPFSLPGLPNPSFTGWGRLPCFFDPFAFNRVFEGIMRLAQTLKDEIPQPPDKVYERLIARIAPLLAEAEQLEVLYNLSRTVKATDQESIGQFMRWFYLMHAQPVSLEGLPAPQGPFPSPFPGFGGISFPFDPCRLERSIGTVRVAHCMCRETYTVTRIINLDRNRADGSERVSAGCHGDLIEIQGNGFGVSMDWGLGDDMQSQVIFSSEGRLGVPADEDTYVLWSETQVKVRVPAGASTGNITLRILCGDIDVSECGLQLKPPSGSSRNRMVTLPTGNPIIEQFAGGNPQWCEDFEIPVLVSNAETVTIRDEGEAEVFFPAGEPGLQRPIEGTIIVSESGDKNYTLTASNACFEVAATIVVERQRMFYIASSGNTPSGDDVTLTLYHFCSPEHLGWSQAVFILTFDDPDEVLTGPPVRMVVTGSNTEARVNVSTRSGECGRVTVTATAEDGSAYEYPFSSDTFFIFGTPHLTDIRTVAANACDPFRFEITGDCLVLNRALLTIHITDAGSGRALWDPVVVEVIPGTGQPSLGVVVMCEVSGALGSAVLNVTAEQFGVTSNALPLTDRGLRIPSPVISTFSSSRSTIYRGGPVEDADLSWEVAHTSRIEIWVSGGYLGRSPGVIHNEDAPTREHCASWPGTYRDRIQFPLTYELRAYSFTGGEPETRRIEITDSHPPDVVPVIRGVRTLRIRNCDTDSHLIHIWLRTVSPVSGLWEEQGTIAAGYDDSGFCPGIDADSLDLSFDDGVIYELQIVDPRALTCEEPYHPLHANCTRLPELGPEGGAVINGDADGYEFAWIFPGPTPF